jgi:glycosyltransferase involved in cell wall biosynthesis
MNALKEKGFNIAFCAPYDKYAEKLKNRGFKYFRINLDRKGTDIFKDLKLIYNLYKIYKKEKPDLVFHYTIKPNIYGAVAAKLAKIKCVNTVTGLGYVFMKENLLSKLVKFLYRISFKFPKKTFFLNESDSEFFIKNRIVNRNKTILVKGSGVNTEFFDSNFCKDFEKEGGKFIFLMASRVLWDKGVGEFVSASRIVKKKYPNGKFLLLGPIDKGNPSAIPEEKIKKWQKQGLINYSGKTDDVRPFICQADCIVLPSYYREGIPRSLLEAMAMEKPIVTTNAVGCREVVEEGKNGYLCEVKNSKDLAIKMEKILNLGEEKRLEMGKYGREKVIIEFDERIVIRKTIRICEELLFGKNES